MADFFKKPRFIFLPLVASLVVLAFSAVSVYAADYFQVAGATADEHFPAVAGSRIVWQDDYAGRPSIHGLTIGGQPAVLAAGGDDRKPRVDGDVVVFERRSSLGEVSDVWMYRYSSSALAAVSDSENKQMAPDVSSERAVWQEFQAPGWEIMIRDLSGGPARSLTKNSFRSLNPRISKNLVVWADDRYGPFDVFLYDLNRDSDGNGVPNYKEGTPPSPDPARKRLTDTDIDEDKIDVDNGKVVWRSFDGNKYDLFLYDTAAPQNGARRLRTVPGIDSRPTITVSGTRVVYSAPPSSADPATTDLYMYNLVSGFTVRLTSNARRREAPEMNGNRLVWHDNRNQYQWDVYRLSFDDTAPSAPATVKATDTERGMELRVAWSASNAGDIWNYQVFRKIGSGPWSNIRTTTSLGFLDTGLPRGRSVYYRVRAIDWSGNVGALSAVGSGVPTDKTPPPAPVVLSTTHPKQTTWYKNNDPFFSWTALSDNTGISGYSYLMTGNPLTVPDAGIESKATDRQTSNKADGLWYFHVRARDGAANWGPAGHRAVRIDTHAPRVARRMPGKAVEGVARDTGVRVKFIEVSNIRRDTLNNRTFKLVDTVTGSVVPATIEYDRSQRIAGLKPYASLAARRWYRVRLTTGIKDLAGWNFAGTVWRFRTGDN